MDDTQLKAALLDLAEFGLVYLDTPENAEQVYNAIPEEIRQQYIWSATTFGYKGCVYKCYKKGD